MKLAARLSLYALIACACVFVASAVMMEAWTLRTEGRQAERISAMLQDRVAENIVAELEGVEQYVRFTRDCMRSGDFRVAEPEARSLLEALISADTIIAGASIAMIPSSEQDEWMLYAKRSPSGIEFRQLGSTDYGYSGKDWFVKPLKLGRGVWSAPYNDEGAGDCLMTTYSLPFCGSEGKASGVVTADVAFGLLAEKVSRLMPYKGTITMITDSLGEPVDLYPVSMARVAVAAGKRAGDGRLRKSGNGRVELLGNEYIYAHTPVSRAGINISTLTPMKSVRRAVTGMKVPLLLILIVFFGLLTFILRMVLSRSMRRLTRLAEAAEKVGKGDFDTEFPSVGKYEDLAQLRDSLSSMLTSVKGYMRDIERETAVRERYESELDIARQIQASMLPEPQASFNFPGGVRLIVGAVLEPAKEVAGDLYDYVRSEGRLYFAIGDVSGKGVPASLVMSSIRSLFHSGAQQGMSPAELMGHVNRSLCERNPQNMFATMLIGMVDPEGGRLVITNAGHTSPVMIGSSGCSFLRLEPGLPVGLFEDVKYAGHTMDFRGGDTILMFTDGVSEAESPLKSLFGEERILQAAENCRLRSGNPMEVIGSLEREIEKFSERPYADDITMLCISSVRQSRRIITLGYDSIEITRLHDFIEAAGEESGWNPGTLYSVALAAEEAISNIINHSRPAKSDSRINIVIEEDESSIKLTIKDSGKEFDPFENAPEVDTCAPASDRKAGGLGIFLIRKLSSEASYRRGENKNILEIIFKK